MPQIDTAGLEIVDDAAPGAAASAEVAEPEEVETSGNAGDAVEASADAPAAAEAAGGADDGEVVISLGDEPTEPAEEEDNTRAPEWIRELRKANREKDRALRAKDEEIARLKGQTAQPAAVTVGEKPKLADCDYDEEKFAEALDAWHERKAQADAEARKVKEAHEAEQRAWAARLESYAKAKATLKVADFEDAEDVVRSATSVTQQGLLLKQKDAANLIYVLGKRPDKLKELAAVTDPIDFTIKATELALQVKVTPKNSAPPPERKLAGGVGKPPSVEARLDELRAEAARTGNTDKLMAYKRQLKAKQAQAA